MYGLCGDIPHPPLHPESQPNGLYRAPVAIVIIAIVIIHIINNSYH